MAAPLEAAIIALGIIQGNVIVTGSQSAQIGPGGLYALGVGLAWPIQPRGRMDCVEHSGGPWQCGVTATAAFASWLVGKATVCVGLDSDRYDRAVSTCSPVARKSVEYRVYTDQSWCF